MFNELKTKLSAFEARIESTLARAQGNVRSVRSELGSIDAVIVGPIEQVLGQIASARASLAGKFKQARSEAAALSPRS
jgi:hypothetical protein